MALKTVYSTTGTPITLDQRDAPTGAASVDTSGNYSYGNTGGTPVSATAPIVTPASPVNAIASTAFAVPGATNPLVTPTAPVKTAAEGVVASTSSLASSAQKSIADQILQAQKDEAASEAKVTDITTQLGLKPSQKTAAYDTVDNSGTSVNGLKREVDDLSSQMEAGNLAATRKVQAIQNGNATGMIGTGAQGEIDRIKRDNASYQADLGIALSAKTRQFSTAKSIIDDKADAETEGLKTELDLAKQFLEKNESNLSDAKKNDWALKIKNLDQQYTKENDERKLVGEVQLAAAKNGAPISTISSIGKSGSYTEALQTAGSYMSSSGGSTTGVITAANGKPLTSDQAKVFGFAQRVSDANDTINSIGDQFASVGNMISQFAPNALKSPERQQFDQAKLNFVNAVLRRESGAAISPAEFSSADKQYFPQPGDSSQVLLQKKTNREQVLQNLAIEAGNPSALAAPTTTTGPVSTPADDAYVKSLNLK